MIVSLGNDQPACLKKFFTGFYMLSLFKDISFSHFFLSFFFTFLRLLSSLSEMKRVNLDALTLKRLAQRAHVHSIPYNGLASGGSDRNPNGTVSNDLEMQRVAVAAERDGGIYTTSSAAPVRSAFSLHIQDERGSFDARNP